MMGSYRDYLSAIVIGDNLLSIIVIAQNSFNLLITDIALVNYFVIVDKRFFKRTVFKVDELALCKKYPVPIKFCCNLKNSLFVLLNATSESVNYSSFFKNLEKHFCNLTYKKTSSNTLKIYCNIYRKNLSAIIYRLSISLSVL